MPVCQGGKLLDLPNSYEWYCILVKWDDFVENPEKYVNAAYDKRTAPIAEKVKVRVTR